MAFTVQDDTGTVVGANAYIDTTFFDSYHGDRGNDISALTSQQKQQAIVKSTDYLDRRFRFIGIRLNDPQATQWPRAEAENADGRSVDGIPTEVKQACAEYALRAATAALAPDPTQEANGATVQMHKQVVGPLEDTIEYANGGAYTLPAYPMADYLLSASGLLRRGKTLIRGG